MRTASFALALGPAVVGLAIRVGADCGNLDERLGAGLASGLGDVARAFDVDRAASSRPNTPHRLMTALAPANRVADAVAVGDVGLHEAELADLGERLDEIVAGADRARDADPDSALEQNFADVAADESAAAEYGHKLFRRARSWHRP